MKNEKGQHAGVQNAYSSPCTSQNSEKIPRRLLGGIPESVGLPVDKPYILEKTEGGK